MQLERLNASLLCHVADVDGTFKVSSATPDAKLACEVARLTTRKDAQRQPHPVGLEAAVDFYDCVARQRSRADHERSYSEAQRRALIVRHSPLERAEDQG